MPDVQTKSNPNRNMFYHRWNRFGEVEFAMDYAELKNEKGGDPSMNLRNRPDYSA
jgi:hypothetical protein